MDDRESGSTFEVAPVRGDASGQDAGRPERRAFPRHVVDCTATVTLLAGSGKIVGRMVDLSRGGCLLTMQERFLVGILSRVEVQFQLRGIAFRIVGVTAGTRTGKSFAVRFLDLPRRREEELEEVLAEVAAAHLASKTKPEAVAPGPIAAAVQTAQVAQSAALPTPVVPAAIAAEPVREAAVVAAGRGDRRSSSRHAVDTRANLILIKSAIRMAGQILNLSQGGCRLRTDERFNVGIYTRVEAEFFLHGLPFRLGGVSQAILDTNTIGIRFLDMSERRRDQLTELIAEIAEDEAIEARKAEARKAEAHKAGALAGQGESQPLDSASTKNL